MCADIYIFCHNLVEIDALVGAGSKFHEYKKVENLFFSCLLTFVVTNVCLLKHSVDRNMQESCKTHQKCLNIL